MIIGDTVTIGNGGSYEIAIPRGTADPLEIPDATDGNRARFLQHMLLSGALS